MCLCPSHLPFPPFFDMFVIRQKTSWILIWQLSLATFTNHTNTVYSKTRSVSKGVYLVFDQIFAPKTFGILPETNNEEAIHKSKGFIFQPSMLSCERFKEEIHIFSYHCDIWPISLIQSLKVKSPVFTPLKIGPLSFVLYLLTRSRPAREDPCLWLRTATSFVKPFFAFRLFACRFFACSYSCWSFNQRRNQLMRFFQERWSRNMTWQRSQQSNPTTPTLMRLSQESWSRNMTWQRFSCLSSLSYGEPPSQGAK